MLRSATTRTKMAQQHNSIVTLCIITQHVSTQNNGTMDNDAEQTCHSAQHLCFFTVMQSVVILSVVMLSVTMLSVTMLSVTMLSVTMLSVTMLSITMLSVTTLSVTMLSVTMLNVTMLSVPMLSVTMLSVITMTITGSSATKITNSQPLKESVEFLTKLDRLQGRFGKHKKCFFLYCPSECNLSVSCRANESDGARKERRV
jgi:hypothetical protein